MIKYLVMKSAAPEMFPDDLVTPGCIRRLLALMSLEVVKGSVINNPCCGLRYAWILRTLVRLV